MNVSELIQWGLNPKFITPDFLRSIGCNETLPERFVKRVTKGSGCWNWPWGNPYGTLGRAGKGTGTWSVHVVSYILHFGFPKSGNSVCHSCENKRCVRPDHLFEATKSEAMAISARKNVPKMTSDELIAWGLNPKFITPEFLISIGCTPSLPVRFVTKVIKSDGCWLWPWGDPYATLGKGESGAGVIGAHVASYVLHFGLTDPGKLVCHHCDTPRCVRPDHLFQDTQAGNMLDAARKGRTRNQTHEGQRRGDDCPASTLDSEQVLKIIELLNTGKRTQQSIADEFGVTQSCVTLIKTGRSWSHLTGIQKPS